MCIEQDRKQQHAIQKATLAKENKAHWVSQSELTTVIASVCVLRITIRVMRLQSSNLVYWADIWHLRRNMPLDEAGQGGTAADHSVEGPQEQTPSVEDHAARLRLEAAVGLWPRSEELEPEHRKSEPTKPHTEEQMVVVWAESDVTPRNEVLPHEEGSEIPKTAVGRVSSVGLVVGVAHIAG